jgi:hypothetical protein
LNSRPTVYETGSVRVFTHKTGSVRSDSAGDEDASTTDPPATTTPPERIGPGPGALLGHLGKALAAAADEGRLDVVAELAGLVSRLAGEGRQEALEARGVPLLSRKGGA